MKVTELYAVSASPRWFILHPSRQPGQGGSDLVTQTLQIVLIADTFINGIGKGGGEGIMMIMQSL